MTEWRYDRQYTMEAFTLQFQAEIQNALINAIPVSCQLLLKANHQQFETCPHTTLTLNTR